MITQVADTQIRSFVRSHMARHQFDAQRMQLRVFNGTVSLSGELWQLGSKPAGLKAIQDLERDIRATSGVHHVSFQFNNWRRFQSGEWQLIGEPSKKTPVKQPPIVQHPGAQTRIVPPAEPVASLVAPIPMVELIQARFRRPRRTS
jgi:hypothetical protein